MGKTYYVYILSSDSGTLYTGITNDLKRRVWEHKQGEVEGFSKRYVIHRLVYYEETTNPEAALEREKQIKSFRRAKKLELIRKMNPKFEDLSLGWFD